MSTVDFTNISNSVSHLALSSEYSKLKVPTQLIKSDDTTKIGQYLSDHNLLPELKKDLGLNHPQQTAKKATTPEMTPLDPNGHKLNTSV